MDPLRVTEVLAGTFSDVTDVDTTLQTGPDGPQEVESAVADHVEPVADSGGSAAFSVRLDEFEGPFDLLLSLIAKHKLDVTALALHTVIDDFLAHIRGRGSQWDLDEASGFLVVAATLLDLKAARLLPSGEVAARDQALAKLHARSVEEAPFLWVAHDVGPRAMHAKVKGLVQPKSWFIDLTTVYIQ